VGTASGINNAVSRVAGVLAVAGLGAAMVIAFGNHLSHRLDNIAMPSEVRAELQSNEIKMAALTPPGSVGAQTRAAVREAVISSFVGSFRLMMGICSGLALISAVVAWSMVPEAAQVENPLPQSISG